MSPPLPEPDQAHERRIPRRRYRERGAEVPELSWKVYYMAEHRFDLCLHRIRKRVDGRPQCGWSDIEERIVQRRAEQFRGDFRQNRPVGEFHHIGRDRDGLQSVDEVLGNFGQGQTAKLVDPSAVRQAVANRVDLIEQRACRWHDNLSLFVRCSGQLASAARPSAADGSLSVCWVSSAKNPD
jgi:hypothetical protein